MATPTSALAGQLDAKLHKHGIVNKKPESHRPVEPMTPAATKAEFASIRETGHEIAPSFPNCAP